MNMGCINELQNFVVGHGEEAQLALNVLSSVGDCCGHLAHHMLRQAEHGEWKWLTGLTLVKKLKGRRKQNDGLWRIWTG